MLNISIIPKFKRRRIKADKQTNQQTNKLVSSLHELLVAAKNFLKVVDPGTNAQHICNYVRRCWYNLLYTARQEIPDIICQNLNSTQRGPYCFLMLVYNIQGVQRDYDFDDSSLIITKLDKYGSGAFLEWWFIQSVQRELT